VAPKRAKELSALEVSRLGDGRHAVGGVAGLYLYVDGPARSWVLRIKVGAKRREAGLGPYPEIGLAKARELAADFREKVRAGRDPIAERQQAQRSLVEAQERAITFQEAAERHHRMKAAEFRSAKHQADWINSLKVHAFPRIGAVPVAELDHNQVMRVLQPIWLEKTETATRVRQRIETILDWAKVSGYREGDNPAAWKGNLENLLPTPNKIRKVKHYPALPYQRLGLFMQNLRTREGTGARALEFAILTCARSREIRLADWREIDLEAMVWTIPAERMKAGKLHRVPLSDEAVAVLRSLRKIRSDGLVFAAAGGGPISDATIMAAIKRMHAEEQKAGRAGWIDPSDGRRVTPHGFRSTFKDWARNCTRFPDEASELALAHVNEDKTRAAYARDELLPMRAKLMQEWAVYAYRATEPGGVIAMRGEA
jgi:integrase